MSKLLPFRRPQPVGSPAPGAIGVDAGQVFKQLLFGWQMIVIGIGLVCVLNAALLLLWVFVVAPALGPR